MKTIKEWLRNWLDIETVPVNSSLSEVKSEFQGVFEISWSERDALALQSFMNSEPGAKFRANLFNARAKVCQEAAFAKTEEERKTGAAHAKAIDTLINELTILAGSVNPIQDSLSSLGVLGAEQMQADDLVKAFNRMASGERYDGADVMGVQ